MPQFAFRIDGDPKRYSCNVFRYHSSLSRLYIRVFEGLKDAPSFYLLFTDVGYFEGPMNWRGVDFVRADAEDCLSLMVATGMVDDMMLDDLDTRQALAEAAYLYTLQTGHSRIRIIAGEAVKLQNLPAEAELE